MIRNQSYMPQAAVMPEYYQQMQPSPNQPVMAAKTENAQPANSPHHCFIDLNQMHHFPMMHDFYPMHDMHDYYPMHDYHHMHHHHPMMDDFHPMMHEMWDDHMYDDHHHPHDGWELSTLDYHHAWFHPMIHPMMHPMMHPMTHPMMHHHPHHVCFPVKCQPAVGEQQKKPATEQTYG